MIRMSVQHRSRSRSIAHILTTADATGLDRGIPVVREEMLRLTAGSISKEVLAALGHPFGRQVTRGRRTNKPRGNLPMLPINRQSEGGMQSTFHVTIVQPSGNSIGAELGFSSPYEPFVLSPTGTKTMVPRGFWVELMAQSRAPYYAAVRQGIKDALRSAGGS